jgi:hypothetical protein
MIFLRAPLLQLASSIDDFVAFSTDADFLAVVEDLAFHPHRFDALVAHQHHVGPVDRRFTFNDATLSILGIGLRVPFDDVDILNEKPIFFMVDPEDLADLAFILAGDDLDFVIFLDLDGVSDHFLFSTRQALN